MQEKEFEQRSKIPLPFCVLVCVHSKYSLQIFLFIFQVPVPLVEE